MLQRHPQGVAEKSHQDMRLGAALQLMKDGPDRQLTLEGAKHRFSFRQLDIAFPKLLRVALGQVGPQQIGPFARLLP